MSMSEMDKREFEGLVAALCEDSLDVAAAARLSALLSEHEDAQKLYIEAMDMHAGLAWDLHERRSSFPLDSTPGSPPPASSPVLGFLGDIMHGNFHLPGSTPILWTFAALAASMLLTLVVLSVIAIRDIRMHVDGPNVAKQPPVVPSPEAPAPGSQLPASLPIARLSRAADCVWTDDAKAPKLNEELNSGRKLSLKSGLAEIVYQNGAKVLLQGPAEFAVRSGASGYLERGKLTAIVEEPEAHGFEIHTPGMKFTDLGTEFGVTVAEDGAQEVEVIRGQVQAVEEKSGRVGDGESGRHGDNPHPLAPSPLILTAGQAIRVEKPQGNAPRVIARQAGKPDQISRIEQSDKSAPDADMPQRPVITKKGTIGIDLCETTPFVFKGRLYRLEWKRANPHDSQSYLRIMDHDSHKEVSRFGAHHRFPCAFVEGDTVYVIGTTEDKDGWSGSTLKLFTSKDLLHWDEHVAYHNPNFQLCNTSLCKAGDRYMMSIELAAGGYVGRFLESKDLLHWTLMPPECISGGSPHLLRWHDGWYYLFSTLGGQPKGYVLWLQRSHDLKTWESCRFNPVMSASQEDKLVFNPLLTEADRAAIAKNGDINNSDIDFCEFAGKLIINYCWGTQGGAGHEYIAEAEYAGTAAQFLTAWFPDMSAWAGIDMSQPPSTFRTHRSDYGRVVSATGATVTTSSTDAVQGRDAQQLLSGAYTWPFAFHTEPEANPWVTIDLGRQRAITGVLIRNRTDCCQERAENLRLQVSDDGQKWREIWKADGVEPRWEIPLLGKDIKARYLRLDTRPKTPAIFHLQHIEVWGTD